MYSFQSQEAKERFEDPRPYFLVDRSLDYPVLISERKEDGSYVPVLHEAQQRMISKEDGFLDLREMDADLLLRELQACVAQDDFKEKRGVVEGVEVYSGRSEIHGIGVFTRGEIRAKSLVGTYNGLVMSYEAYDCLEGDEEEFLFVLNDGENGVAVDGNHDPTSNALKYLNHSCDPNVMMKEVFLPCRQDQPGASNRGSWVIAVLALRKINPGEELVHDFKLHTEEEALKDIQCLCGSQGCQGLFYAFHQWPSSAEEAE